jgi:hypothetical protein
MNNELFCSSEKIFIVCNPGIIMNPKILRIIAVVLVVISLILFFLDYLGMLTPSTYNLRTVLLAAALVALLLARFRGARQKGA